jgi:hypothetical protein
MAYIETTGPNPHVWWHGYSTPNFTGASSISEIITASNQTGSKASLTEMGFYDENGVAHFARLDRLTDGTLIFNFEILGTTSNPGGIYPVLVGAVFGRPYHVELLVSAGSHEMIVTDTVTGQESSRTVTGYPGTKINTNVTYMFVNDSEDPSVFPPGTWSTITAENLPSTATLDPYDVWEVQEAPSFAGRSVVRAASSATMTWFYSGTPPPGNPVTPTTVITVTICTATDGSFGGGSITILGYGTYSNGQTLQLPPGTYTVTAVPPAGKNFWTWTIAGEITYVDQSAASTTATISGAPATLYANFLTPKTPSTVQVTIHVEESATGQPVSGANVSVE